MCTGSSQLLRSREAFTVMELLLAITLTVALALAVGPLIVSIEDTGVRETDRTVALLQGRVAIARLEADLRTATAVGSTFIVDGPLLQATPRQIVLLGRRSGSSELSIIEWEIVGSRLMRRWGTCPEEKPDSFPHTLYVDSKTMLEGVGDDCHLSFFMDDVWRSDALNLMELPRVAAVAVEGNGVDPRGSWVMQLAGIARLGR